jgi:hypothetical protein
MLVGVEHAIRNASVFGYYPGEGRAGFWAVSPERSLEQRFGDAALLSILCALHSRSWRLCMANC